MNGKTVHVVAAAAFKDQIYLNTISLNTKKFRSFLILGISHEVSKSLKKDINKVCSFIFLFWK